MIALHFPFMRRDRQVSSALLVVCAAVALGCSDRPGAYRGPGLPVASLPLNDVVGVYHAALAGSFRLDDASLLILADPTFLPRTSGLAGGDSMPRNLLAALRAGGVVKGTCAVPVANTRWPLVCRAEYPGYVVRFSQPFAMGGGHDSMQVHLVIQQYATPSSAKAERLRFERAYYVARQGSSWRAVREARLPQP